jgi:hypothetical protein
VINGDRNAAYLKAGFSGTPKTCNSNAYKLFRQLQNIIQEQIEKKIGRGAIKALSVIEELMDNSDSDTVKLAAAKDYLSRAGYDVPVESRVRVEKVDDSSLEDDIQELLDKAQVKEDQPTKH